MQTPETQPEHLWLHQLVGEWSNESECILGPDQPPMKTTGREVVRLLGSMLDDAVAMLQALAATQRVIDERRTCLACV